MTLTRSILCPIINLYVVEIETTHENEQDNKTTTYDTACVFTKQEDAGEYRSKLLSCDSTSIEEELKDDEVFTKFMAKIRTRDGDIKFNYAYVAVVPLIM